MDITDRKHFSVPEDNENRCLDASGEWFQKAADFVTNACTSARPPVPFNPTPKMVGLKLRRLGSKYGNTIPGWEKCHDELKKAHDDRRSAANTPEICREPQAGPGIMGSESELRRMYTDERKSRVEAWKRLGKVVAIENKEEKADALDRYWESANPMMDMSKPVRPAELVTDADDGSLIKHLFQAAGGGNMDRCQLLEELAQDLQQSKKAVEKKTGSLICNTLTGQRNITQLGIKDIITQMVESAAQHAERWSQWSIMPHLLEDWFRRMGVASSHGYNSHPDGIWKKFNMALASVAGLGNPWRLLSGSAHQVS